MPLESRPPAAKVYRIGADPEGKVGRHRRAAFDVNAAVGLRILP